jgi:hypothetical protein
MDRSEMSSAISTQQAALADIIVKGLKAGASSNEIAAMILEAGYAPPDRRGHLPKAEEKLQT